LPILDRMVGKPPPAGRKDAVNLDSKRYTVVVNRILIPGKHLSGCLLKKYRHTFEKSH